MTASAAFTAKGAEVAASARVELFVAFIEEMNRARISYCLLSGYESYPDAGDSDVDFMVRLRDAEAVQEVLRAVARHTGGLLVQALQHETDAWYFVLAKPEGNATAYLHPDCCTDYRRDGRLWLQAEAVLARRRRLGEFYVAAEPDEFLYYLIR